MTIFDRMKEKRKEEYTIGELMIAYLCGYGLTFGCGALVALGIVIGIPFVETGMINATWSQWLFFECACVFLVFFGASVAGYLDMWRW